MNGNDDSGRAVPPTQAMHAAQAHTPAPPPYRPDRGGGGGGSSGMIIAAVAAIGCLGLMFLGVIGAGAAMFLVSAADFPVYPDGPPPPPTATPVAVGAPTVGFPTTSDPHAAERLHVPIPPGAPARGAAEPRVTIVMFSDFQCPFCGRVEPTIERILAQHPGDVRVVWMNQPLPFHRAARVAAQGALEAQAQRGDAGFWAMHDLLFANQSTLDRDRVFALGMQLELDPTRLAAALDGTVHQAAIDADVAVATRVGARGTPSFFLNGRPLTGAQPFDSFERVIQEELAHAMRFESAGVPRARLYDAITEHALAAAPAAEPRPAAPTEDPDRVFRVPVGTSPAQGPADALVTIVVFSDFQCPFCGRVVPTLARLRETYGADLRIVFKHNPLAFHERALPAAIAATEVYSQGGADAFFRMHDVLFENRSALEDADLVRYAEQVGVRGAPVRAALERQSHRDTIQADQDLAAELGARGTPQFFVNGRSLRGAQPYERFAELVDAERERARAMVAAGTPRDRVYDVVMTSAR